MNDVLALMVVYHNLFAKLHKENEQLLAINDALNYDLTGANETIEMLEGIIDDRDETIEQYETEITDQIELQLDGALEQMFDRAFA